MYYSIQVQQCWFLLVGSGGDEVVGLVLVVRIQE